jgi:3-methyladenine DNA glycosylase AlkD
VECFGDRTFDALTDLEPLVRTLWDSAAFREERFVALGILRLPAARRLMSAKAQPLFEHLILTGAWWDLVDELSTHVVARALDHDVAMAGVVRTWAHSEALWLKRAALVCQVVRGSKTDVALLEEVIEASLGGTDFFLRKGIGWAMRSLARHHPSVVRRWLQRWRRQLSPLSVREAKKGLVRSKKAPR